MSEISVNIFYQRWLIRTRFIYEFGQTDGLVLVQPFFS